MRIVYNGNIYEYSYEGLIGNKNNPIVGGIGDNFEEYDSNEMNIGIEIEKEHIARNKELTDNEIISIAKDIARDHLKEIPDYYSRLVKMEKEAKNKKI